MAQQNRKDHLLAFSQRLNLLLAQKHWSAAKLAREASKFVPEKHVRKGKRYVIGRHLISAYCRGENEPNSANLNYISLALDVAPQDLLSTAKKPPTVQSAQAITLLHGKTRLVIDVEVETSTAMQILSMLRAELANNAR